jgi:hypothetical protein
VLTGHAVVRAASVHRGGLGTDVARIVVPGEARYALLGDEVAERRVAGSRA